ncbi:MAG: M36 family metallopeptidase [Pyrinomonadaceae bacterium]
MNRRSLILKGLLKTRTRVAITLFVSIAAVALGVSLVPGSKAQRGSLNNASTKKASLASKNFDARLMATQDVERLAQNSQRGLGKNGVIDVARQQAAGIVDGLAALKSRVPNASIQLSPLTAAVEIVDGNGALTGNNRGMTGEMIVRNFISANKELYGLNDIDIANLRFLGESDSPSGIKMVRVEQMVRSTPIFQSETRFILDRNGRVVRSLGSMIPKADEAADSNAGIMTPEQALRATMRQLGVDLDGSQFRRVNSDDEEVSKIAVDDARIEGNVTSKIVYFPVAPGVLVPAWSQVVFGNDADWYVLVDARDGTMLWRKNIKSNVSTHNARFRVYVQADGTTPADSPAPQSPSAAVPGGGTQFGAISPTIVSMFTAMDPLASQNGWIDDCPGGICTANETQTIGNNVHAYMDRVGGAGAGGANQPDTAASSVLDGNGKPIGNPDANGRNRDFLGTAPRDFETNYLPPPQGGNPEAGQTATGNGNNGTLPVDQYRRGMLTQLFYVSNWYHDKLFALGFNEGAGNFQQTNFSGTGLGGDRVLAEGQDSSSTDNANFSTPPDGQSGRAQMFRFIGPTVDRDGSLDTEVLIHELTHGTSNRLIGNAAGLVWDPGTGMGEGWSDFYAMSLLNNTNADDPNASYATGAYATYKAFGIVSYTDNYVYGIRRFPYSTNNTVNPLTWADVDDYTNNLSGGIAPDPLGNNIGGAQEVHNTGEIWALSLWEVRSRIIAANAGSVPTGNQKTLQLVTDGMKLTPSNPSYVQARDAIISADCATNACANEDSIWNGFADRGLGYGAKVSSAYGFAPIATHQGIAESFSAPSLDIQSVTVDDSIGNNNGAIDPNEPVRITVALKNPWRSASKNVAAATATLTTSTPGVVITDGNSSYPAIPAQGSAVGDTFAFTVPAAATCGQSLNFTVMPNSSLSGQVPLQISFRVGAPAGTGAPITYTRTPGAPLAIQDLRPRGTIDSQTITDDFEIADINVRIDSITHTFPGDVTFGIKAPNSYGVDLVTFIGGAVAGGGDGDNITNMVIDNQAVGDMLLATNAQAPYTGSWLPIANSPSWPVLGFGPQEPVGELNKLNGTSTLGTWRVLASDQAAGDVGTLNSWSLIVTPRAFACTPYVAAVNPTFTPAAAISRQQGTPPGAAVQVGTVTDPDTPIANLTVTQIAGGTATGVTVSGITVNPGTGAVSAVVSASCSATAGTVRFQVSDGTNTGTGDLQVNITANTAPTLTAPANQTVVFGQGAAYPTTSSDNGTMTYSVVSTTPAMTTPPSISPTGVVSVANSGPIGAHTIVIRATDNCGAFTDASFTVTVNQAATTTVVQTAQNAPTYGQSTTITASVAANPPGGGVPQGTVNFLDGATPIAACQNVALNGLGSAACSLNTLGAGTHTINVNYSGNTNYLASSGSAQQTVLKAALNITASSHNVTYGDAVPTITPTFSGFVLGESSANLTTQPNCSTTYTQGAGAAGSPYPTSCTGAVSANYAFNYINGSINVAKKGLTVTADNKTRAYGAANPALTATITGFIGADNAGNSTTGTAGLSTTATATSPVGNYPITATLGTLASSNYTFTTFNAGTLSITAVQLTVTANNQTRVYGAPNPTLTYSITGFVNGEGVGVVTGTPNITTTANATSAPGTYPITTAQGTLAAPNYTFTTANGTLTVTQAATTTTITNAAALGNPTSAGQSYAVNWSTTPVAPATGTPTGNVTVSDGAGATCTAAVAAGTCNLTSATSGTKTITATYAGDANFTGSTSQSVQHNVVNGLTGNVKQFIAFGTNTNLAGVTMTLLNTGTQQAVTTTTDANGNYSFSTALGQSYTITPSGLGKAFEATSRTYTNVAGNISGADFIAYDVPGPNAIPRSARVSSQIATQGQPVTVPVLITTTGVETKVSFSVEYPTGPLGVPTVTCGTGAVNCTLTVDNSLAGKTGITVTPANSNPLTAGTRELVKITFPTQSNPATSAAIKFGDFPQAKDVRNAENNPLPMLYWTDGLVSFTGGTLLDGATISGRVLNANGQGVRNATVTIIDPVGNRRTATTGSFGNYTFEGLELGRDYLITVTSKRYRFPTRTVNLTENLSGVDLTGLE